MRLTQPFNPSPIRAQVGITGARRGPHVNRTSVLRQEKLKVVDEAEHRRPAFHVKVVRAFRDDPRSRFIPQHLFQRRPRRFRLITGGERGNKMRVGLIRAANTIGR